MKRVAIALAILLATVTSTSMHAQETQSCAHIVKQVSFEHPSGLTSAQLATLRALVIGRCYDPENAVFVSGYVFDQLRTWDYKQATVYEPSRFQVLDAGAHPTPIAIAIDLRLSGLDDKQPASKR